VDCKGKYPEVELGEYIDTFDKRNAEKMNYPFYGINKDKTFMPTVADTNDLDNSKYKVVNNGEFVFSGMQTGRDVCIRIALYNDTAPIIISPAYTTFRVKEGAPILPQYLFLQFKRLEMDRYGWFLSDGSIRSNLEWERFCEIKLPLPPMEIQRSIVNLFNCLEEAKKIASEAREKLKTLCPALVQRAANS
jgi:type I restriction enzyme S subunit